MSILIKNVLLKDKIVSILIEGNSIKKIATNVGSSADKIIDGSDKAVFPSFFNAHTHAGMTLFRGFGDDLPLMEWLETKIWPYEKYINENDVYWGTRLACLEMIKSGTTFFNDMYWMFPAAAQAVEDSGIRAAIAAVFIDSFEQEKANEQRKQNQRLYAEMSKYSDRIMFCLGPHAPYTVSLHSLEWIRDFSIENEVIIHMHLSETENEVKEFVEKYGKRPFEFLDDLGFLSSKVIAVHTIWLSDKEMNIIAERGVNVVHNPTSNMKLGIGGDIFHYRELKERGVNVCLGTDGAGSNNNLDMLESMKFAALLQKFHYSDTTVLPVREAFDMGTVNCANAFGINAGIIEEGKLADLVLVDISKPKMTPRHDILSNLVYSSNGECVDTVICDGKVLMENRVVEGEEEIVSKANEVAFEFMERKDMLDG
ncbi:amidohydrolase [bacterium]|nr:amidohydrolase [bacterium]